MLKNVSQHHSLEYLEAGVVLRFQEQCILYSTKNHLRFGPLEYLLEFEVDSEAGFSAARAQYMYHQSDSDTELCPLLDSLPMPTQVRIGDVIIHHTVSRGAFGVVRVGVHILTGEVVALKTVTPDRHCDAESVKREIVIASKISSMVGVVPLIKAWCEHGNPFPCLKGQIEDVHFLSK